MIGKIISHYKILEKLGGGGMGVVYKAQDTKLDRFVAPKFLPPHLGVDEEEKKRFIHEAKATSGLSCIKCFFPITAGNCSRKTRIDNNATENDN